MPLVRITLAAGRTAPSAAGSPTPSTRPWSRPRTSPRTIASRSCRRCPPTAWSGTPATSGQSRSPQVVFVEITLNAGRTVEVKKALYAAIAEGLGTAAGLRPDDVLVNLVEVPRENWSFGGGVMSYPPVA